MDLPNDVEWCCAGFKANYQNAGRRGMGVLVSCRDGKSRFYLQCRAVARGDESQVPVTPTGHGALR